MMKRVKLIVLCLLVLALTIGVLVSCNAKKDVRFLVDGQEYNFQTIKKMDDITIPENPTKVGYTFDGWDYDFSNEITENISINAKWIANKYTITFDVVGGDAIANQEVTYDQAYTLPTTSREGYTFVGWFNGESQVNDGVWTIDGNVTLVARWSKNEYTITYNLNGGENAIENPTSYSIDTPTITLTNPTKRGYNFLGWTEGSNIPTGSIGNKTFTANWELINYSIVYLYNDGQSISKAIPNSLNPLTYTIEDTIVFEEPSRSGYTFTGWDVETIEAGTIGEKTVTASWKIIENVIVYDLNVEASSVSPATNNGSNPATYTVEDTIIFAEPTRAGYTFTGWDVETIEAGTIGEKTVTASWEIINYAILYNLNNGINSKNNPTSYTVETETITLKDAIVTNGKFGGWYTTKSFAGDMVTTIAKGSTGDLTLYANVISYAIESAEGFEIVGNTIRCTVSNSTDRISLKELITVSSGCTWEVYKEYTVETLLKAKNMTLEIGDNYAYILVWSPDGEDFNQYEVHVYRLHTYTYTYKVGDEVYATETHEENSMVTSPTDPIVAHYELTYWDRNGEAVVFPEICKCDTTLEAVFTPVEYNIIYALDEGVMNNENNPKSYNIENWEVVISSVLPATKDYYDFVEWIISVEDYERLEDGTFGAITIRPIFTPIVYSITYALTEDVIIDENAVAEYTIESETIVLSEPMRVFYTFDGWYTDSALQSAISQIDVGSHGDVVLYPKWIANDYSITIDLVGGSSETQYPMEYNVENGEQRLAIVVDDVPTKDHYIFTGWESVLDNEDNPTNENILDITFVAQWTPVQYTLTYELDGGVIEGEYPVEYNVETETFTLITPTKRGYDFLGWTGYCGLIPQKTVTIETGSYDDREYFACWQLIDYKISYNLGDNSSVSKATNPNPTTYTIYDEITFTSPSRVGYIFTGWDIDGIELNTVGKKTITASWEVIEYAIVYDLNVEKSSVSPATNNGSNPAKYTVEDTIIFAEPTRAGYTFTGWDVETIEAGTIGAKTITASWEIIEYAIAYDLKVEESSVSPATNNESNPATYTIEDEITFGEPTRAGYTFTGWDVETIEAGTIGEKTVTASWEIITYTITYVLNDSTNSVNNPTSYNVEQCPIILEEATFEYDLFHSWRTSDSLEGAQVSTISVGNVANYVLYAICQVGTEGLIYNLDTSTDTYSVGGYEGASSKVYVPSRYQGKYVTSISSYAFENNVSIVEISLSKKITSIGSSAFYNCSSLESIVIPDSVTSIGKDAFFNCRSLTSINYLGTIEQWCGITFGNSSANPLYYVKNLYLNGELVTELVIPNRVTRIEDYAFYNCDSLTSIVIPNSVTSIRGDAFYGCSSLTSVNYLGTIEQWCGITFGNCYSNPLYYAKNLYLNGELVTELVIPYTVTKINSYAFSGCSSLTSVVIPDSVTSIGGSTFYNCSSLESVEIGNSVTSIGGSTFYNCSSLESVVIPNSVTSIGGSAFYNCSSLESVVIPNSVKSIGSYAFYFCSKLTSIYYNGDATMWNSISIGSNNSDLTDATRYYYSETEPTKSGNYWHYVDGVVTVW